MARILDLNNIQVPTLDLTFRDPNRTMLHVTAPTEALINELECLVKTNGLQALAAGDQESVALSYNLTARLLSCNQEGLAISADDLRGKYGVTIWTLIPLLQAYLEFVGEIKNAKN